MIITSECYRLADEIQKCIRDKLNLRILGSIISECEREVNKDKIKIAFVCKPTSSSIHNPIYRTLGLFSKTFLKDQTWNLDVMTVKSIPLDLDRNFTYDSKTSMWVFRIPIAELQENSKIDLNSNVIVFPILKKPDDCKYFKAAQSIVINKGYIEIGYKDILIATEANIDINIIYSKN